MAALISPESQAAHVGRLRRLAVQTAAKGMNCTVSGAEIRGVLAALDAATERAEAAEASVVEAPRRGRPPKDRDGSVRELVAACAEVLSDRHPELWGQSLPVALKAFCESQGTPLPAEWERLMVGL